MGHRITIPISILKYKYGCFIHFNSKLPPLMSSTSDGIVNACFLSSAEVGKKNQSTYNY